ncbi:MAG: hypothetical protein ACREAS_04575 [Nitrososphaera sp.]|jgi:hypothetical protein
MCWSSYVWDFMTAIGISLAGVCQVLARVKSSRIEITIFHRTKIPIAEDNTNKIQHSGVRCYFRV